MIFGIVCFLLGWLSWIGGVGQTHDEKQRVASPLILLQGAPGQAVFRDSTENQTITQPAGTTLTPNSLDSVLYADKCTGTDIGMKINTCAASLPLSGGYHVGTIILPNTSSDTASATWATTVHIGPGVNLTGQGLLASSFHCTVAGDCLLHDESGSTGIYAHTTGVTSVYQGFTITGNGATGQNIFHFKDAVNLTVRDVGADGATAAGSACFLLDDVNYWTERNTFSNVSTLYGCAIGWRFISDAKNPNQPHPSFGYNRFLDIKANPNNGQTAFSFEGNSFIYAGTYRITVNSDGPGNTIIHMQDGAEFHLNELHFMGETSSHVGTLLDIASPSNQFTYFGDFEFAGLASKFAAGSVVTHYLDAASYGPQVPNKTWYAINSVYAERIVSGSDLNNILTCGRFEGSNSPNTPTAIGNQFYRLDVVCGGEGGQQNYLTQIIYAAQFTFGANKVFYRVRDNSVWYPWREMGFKTDVPTAGTTQSLPSAAIAAGVCTNLTTVINNASGNMAIAATPNSTTQLIPGLHWDTAYISSVGGPLMLANDASGTSVNHLVTQTANGKVLKTSTSDIGGILGLCTSGCSTSGTAAIATTGTASLVYDGATTRGDFVINSKTIAGAAHDFGPSPTGATSQILGQVLSTNGSAGSYATNLQTGAPSSVTVTVPVCNLTASPITPNITPTFNVRLIP